MKRKWMYRLLLIVCSMGWDEMPQASGFASDQWVVAQMGLVGSLGPKHSR